MAYFDFRKEKDYLICIDSDGCAMDTMDVKHKKCFGPEWIKTYGLDSVQDKALEYWNKVNLYSGTRGINRFKGLAMGLEEVERGGFRIDGLADFVDWTRTAKELSNPALLAQCQKTRNECMEKALLWSIHVNLSITELPKEDKPFPNVKDAMDELCHFADIVAVSSANAQAVEREWTEHKLKEDTRALLSQEAGSKSYCIHQLLDLGYSPKHTIMIGDAPGDLDAAAQNNVWFYPILVGRESESWMRLKNEAFPRLQNNQFNNLYQMELIAEFEESLGLGIS